MLGTLKIVVLNLKIFIFQKYPRHLLEYLFMRKDIRKIRERIRFCVAKTNRYLFQIGTRAEDTQGDEETRADRGETAPAEAKSSGTRKREGNRCETTPNREKDRSPTNDRSKSTQRGRSRIKIEE